VNWVKNIADQSSIIVGLSFLISLTLTCFIYPYLSDSDLNNPYHQNRELSKLPPFSKVRFIKLVQNNASPGSQERDPYIYEPFDHYEVMGDRILIYLKDSFKQYHIADVCYAISDQELQTLEGQYSGYTFTNMSGERVRTTQRDLIQRIRKEFVVTKRFWLGTDQLGRNMLGRILEGGKISLSLALLAVLITVVFGVGIGLIAGYFGGWVDRILTLLLGLFWSIPGVLFVVIIALVVGSAKVGVVVGITFVMWVEMAQIVKTRVEVIRNQAYIQASRLIGLSHIRVILKHILPNVSAPIFILAASSFADALMLEAGLSFLGIGINPPDPSWGNMIRTTYGYMLTDQYAYMVLIPSLMLFLVVLSAIFVSNGLKDAFDLSIERPAKFKL
jgi:peptide/nickel transport system permease protein